jgi:hypothetical protein
MKKTIYIAGVRKTKVGYEKEIRVLKIGHRKGIYKKLSASFISCLFFGIVNL